MHGKSPILVPGGNKRAHAHVCGHAVFGKAKYMCGRSWDYAMEKKSILNRETIVHVWSVLDRETSVPI